MTILTYSQSTGRLTGEDGALIGIGWAGFGEGKNSTAHESIRYVGPLPRGLYEVGPWEAFHAGLGPLVARLIQVEGEAFGRDNFFIHGASMDPEKRGQESHGCIVLPRKVREAVAHLGPKGLQVVE